MTSPPASTAFGPPRALSTDIAFDLSPNGDRTEVRFTHLGLVPDFECFDNCSNAWGFYIKSSLRDFIATGKGEPNEKERGD